MARRQMWLATFAALSCVCAAGEIVVDTRVKLALRVRAAESVTWCDVFYAEDFPEDAICQGKETDSWDYFPACCNGAYKCKNGELWDMHLCPREMIYNATTADCDVFDSQACPYAGGVGGESEETDGTGTGSNEDGNEGQPGGDGGNSGENGGDPDGNGDIGGIPDAGGDPMDPEVSCGTLVNGKLPYSDSCFQYIQCTNTVATVEYCREGYIYYEPFGDCLPGDLKMCELLKISSKRP